MESLPRGIEQRISDLMAAHRVVIVEGPRACGKTTLTHEWVANRGGTVLDLSDPTIAAAVEADAHGLLSSAPQPVLIDEAQLFEPVTLAVKRIVDRSPAPGQFLLTGSARIGRGALGGSDPLAGRAVWASLAPFTVGERLGQPHNAVKQLLDGPPSSGIRPEVTRETLTRLVTRGGIPTVPGVLDPAARHSSPEGTAPPVAAETTTWQVATEVFAGYLESALSFAAGRYDADRHRLTTAFRYLAANPAQVLNVSRMGSELSLNRETATRYLQLLSDALLLRSLPKVRPTEHRSIAAHPKVHVFDTGFATWAAAQSPETLWQAPTLWGGLVESFVVNELAAQASWMSDRISIGYWREGRAEVDAVLTLPNGTRIGIEVKASSEVRSSDCAGLRAFRNQIGTDHRFSLVIYSGNVCFEIEEGIYAMPISDLWNPS